MSSNFKRIAVAGAAILATAVPATAVAATSGNDDSAANGLRRQAVVKVHTGQAASQANGLANGLRANGL